MGTLTHLYVHVETDVCIDVYIFRYMRSDVRVFVCMCNCVHICMNTYICMWTCLRARVFARAHTDKRRSELSPALRARTCTYAHVDMDMHMCVCTPYASIHCFRAVCLYVHRWVVHPFLCFFRRWKCWHPVASEDFATASRKRRPVAMPCERRTHFETRGQAFLRAVP